MKKLKQKITYERFSNYYIFSHEPEIRVYIGNAKPEDYIRDVEEQEKRNKSAYYLNTKTGDKVHLNEFLNDVQRDLLFYEKHEFKCDYEFEKMLNLTILIGSGKKCKYVTQDHEAKKLAESWFFDLTMEEWTKKQEDFKKECTDMAIKYPILINLIFAGIQFIM